MPRNDSSACSAARCISSTSAWPCSWVAQARKWAWPPPLPPSLAAAWTNSWPPSGCTHTQPLLGTCMRAVHQSGDAPFGPPPLAGGCATDQRGDDACPPRPAPRARAARRSRRAQCTADGYSSRGAVAAVSRPAPGRARGRGTRDETRERRRRRAQFLSGVMWYVYVLLIFECCPRREPLTATAPTAVSVAANALTTVAIFALCRRLASPPPYPLPLQARRTNCPGPAPPAPSTRTTLHRTPRREPRSPPHCSKVRAPRPDPRPGGMTCCHPYPFNRPRRDASNGVRNV